MGGKRSREVNEGLYYDDFREKEPIASTSKTFVKSNQNQSPHKSFKLESTASSNFELDTINRAAIFGDTDNVWRDGTIIPDSEPPEFPRYSNTTKLEPAFNPEEELYQSINTRLGTNFQTSTTISPFDSELTISPEPVAQFKLEAVEVEKALSISELIHPELLAPSTTSDEKPDITKLASSFYAPSASSSRFSRSIRAVAPPPIYPDNVFQTVKVEDDVNDQVKKEDKDRIKVRENERRSRSIAPSPDTEDQTNCIKFEKQRSLELGVEVREEVKEESEEDGEMLPPSKLPSQRNSTTTSTSTSSSSNNSFSPILDQSIVKKEISEELIALKELPIGPIRSKFFEHECLNLDVKDEEDLSSRSVSTTNSPSKYYTAEQEFRVERDYSLDDKDKDDDVSLRSVSIADFRNDTEERESRIEREVESEIRMETDSELSEPTSDEDINQVMERKSTRSDSLSDLSSSEDENDEVTTGKISTRLRKDVKVPIVVDNDSSDFTDSEEEEKEEAIAKKAKKGKKEKKKKVVKVKRSKPTKKVKEKKGKDDTPEVTPPLPPPPPVIRPFGIKAKLFNQAAVETAVSYPQHARVQHIPLSEQLQGKKLPPQPPSPPSIADQFLDSLSIESNNNININAREIVPIEDHRRVGFEQAPPSPVDSLEDYIEDEVEEEVVFKEEEVSILQPQAYFENPTKGGAIERWYLKVAGESDSNKHLVEIEDDYNYSILESDVERLDHYHLLPPSSKFKLFLLPREYQRLASNSNSGWLLLISKPGGSPQIRHRIIETPLQKLWTELLLEGNPSKPKFPSNENLTWEEKRKELGEEQVQILQEVMENCFCEDMEIIEGMLGKVFEGNWIWFKHIFLLAQIKSASFKLARNIDIAKLDLAIQLEEHKIKIEIDLKQSEIDSGRCDKYTIQDLLIQIMDLKNRSLVQIKKDNEMLKRFRKRLEME